MLFEEGRGDVIDQSERIKCCASLKQLVVVRLDIPRRSKHHFSCNVVLVLRGTNKELRLPVSLTRDGLVVPPVLPL